jgi:hypothetical protein
MRTTSDASRSNGARQCWRSCLRAQGTACSSMSTWRPRGRSPGDLRAGDEGPHTLPRLPRPAVMTEALPAALQQQTMPKTCIICGKRAGSHEHTFPAALGGRRTNKGSYCGLHNNGFSSLAKIQDALYPALSGEWEVPVTRNAEIDPPPRLR